MAIQTQKRTTISFNADDLRKLAKLMKREGINTIVGTIRWAVTEVLK